MISIAVEHRTVLDALNRLADTLAPQGMRPAMKEIGEELIDSTRQRFQASTAPDGSRWPALSHNTVLARLGKTSGAASRRGGKVSSKGAATGMKPLIDTGQLSKTIRYQIIDGGAGVAIGTNRSFGSADASVHQFGTSKAGRGHNVTIPPRPFLGLSVRDGQTVLDILQRALGG